MTKTQLLAIDKWEETIRKALNTGKGKYQYEYAKDLHDWLKLIQLIRDEELDKAFEHYRRMDTNPREQIPLRILNIIDVD